MGKQGVEYLEFIQLLIICHHEMNLLNLGDPRKLAYAIDPSSSIPYWQEFLVPGKGFSILCLEMLGIIVGFLQLYAKQRLYH